MVEFTFKLDESGPDCLELAATVSDWTRIFHLTQERATELGWSETALVSVRVPGAGTNCAPPPSQPDHPDKVKDALGNLSLSSKALKLRRLVTQTPGLKRGKAMQKLALGAADFDEVLAELGSAVVCVECGGGRGRPSRRLWVRGSDASGSQLELDLSIAEDLEREFMESLPAFLPSVIVDVLREARKLGSQIEHFHTLASGDAITVDGKVVWREIAPAPQEETSG